MGGGGEVGVVGGSLISTLKNFTMSFGACAKNCKRGGGLDLIAERLLEKLEKK